MEEKVKVGDRINVYRCLKTGSVSIGIFLFDISTMVDFIYPNGDVYSLCSETELKKVGTLIITKLK